MTRAAGLKTAIAAFMTRQRIPGEMEQNLVKEAIHLHLLSALSDAGILRHVAFQGGTALRLCYGGERYSEDLGFVCGKSGSYLDDVEFADLVDAAVDATKRSLQREFDVDPSRITVRAPQDPSIIREADATVATWQIVVPVTSTPRSPTSRTKIEFANVPSYDNGPRMVRATPGLVQVQDVILAVESPQEILADKAVAIVARSAMKHRDLWDVWFLTNRYDAHIDRETVRRKFADYGTTDVESKARNRLEELAQATTTKGFLDEMRRFLPAKRIAEVSSSGLHHAILAESGELIRRGVLPVTEDTEDGRLR
jgi:predicted nucleotidyltransferase component of viral defense system